MSTINPRFGRVLAGCGGALLIGSLFMPWSENAAGISQSGWEALTVSDVLFLITGLFGLAAAITGGRFGFFRRDVSLNGATDILSLVASILLAWLILFDWPAGASRQAGVYLALVGAVAITTGTGDFRVTSLFPRILEGDRPNHPL
jgi:hypothetical protein